MRDIFSKKGCVLLVLLAALGGGAAYLILGRSEPSDTRFNGAYLLEDGRLVFVTPSEG